MDIYVYNTSNQLVGIVDTIESIIWTDRYQRYGDFELYTNFTAEIAALMQPDYYLDLKYSGAYYTPTTMIIESVEIKTNAETGNKLIVKGRNLASILDRRLVYQVQSYSDVSLQTAIQDILYKNLVNAPGQPQRNIPNFTYTTSTDPLVTTPLLTAEYYGQEVYGTIVSLCQKNKLGFKVVFTGAGYNIPTFSLYAGVDHSYGQSTKPFVIFSPKFDNLISSDYFYNKQPKKTIALCFGDPYNGPRPTTDFDPWQKDPTDPHYPTTRTGLTRREWFSDQNDLGSIDPGTGLPYPDYYKMQWERARKELNENVEVIQFTGEADTLVEYKFGVDFSLGDLVELEDMFGNKGTVRVTEAIISENASGIFVYPTFEKEE